MQSNDRARVQLRQLPQQNTKASCASRKLLLHSVLEEEEAQCSSDSRFLFFTPKARLLLVLPGGYLVAVYNVLDAVTHKQRMIINSTTDQRLWSMLECQVAFPEYLWPVGIIINNPSQHSPPYKYEEIISCATSIHALIEIRPGWVRHQHTSTESVVLLCSDGPNI